jgi:hypothetical protein
LLLALLLLATYTKVVDWELPPLPFSLLKFAVIDMLPSRVTLQFALPLQAPAQEVKASLLPGVSLRVTGVFGGKVKLQVVGQLIPAGLLVTVPAPFPAMDTVSTSPRAKVALTFSVPVIDTVQGAVPEHAPLQPSKK